MNQDPLDALSEFYDACRIAPAPTGEPLRRRFSLVIPATGVALGLAAALAVALFPTEPSPDAFQRTVEAIALRQQPAAEPLSKQGMSMIRPGRKAWRA